MSDAGEHSAGCVECGCGERREERDGGIRWLPHVLRTNWRRRVHDHGLAVREDCWFAGQLLNYLLDHDTYPACTYTHTHNISSVRRGGHHFVIYFSQGCFVDWHGMFRQFVNWHEQPSLRPDAHSVFAHLRQNLHSWQRGPGETVASGAGRSQMRTLSRSLPSRRESRC
eukprot:341772-Pleurochrysis_carterae.AAC.1